MYGLLNWKSAPIEPLLMDYQQLEGAYKSTGPLSNFRGGGVGKEREREQGSLGTFFPRKTKVPRAAKGENFGKT